MATREQVEGYLLQAGLDHEEIGEGMWLAGASAGPGIVIHFSPPLLVFRMKVMDLPADEPRCAQLYRRLLELNATDLVHAAYALEEGDVILTATLPVENLDFNEFQATIDSFQMALASHLESLAEFRDCAPAQA
ncbi:MAG TPA: YbjN domain-containing protein [Longimicrobium sp.]|nr:YbjN domain-containing protein [Longimicrobium sp.]